MCCSFGVIPVDLHIYMYRFFSKTIYLGKLSSIPLIAVSLNFFCMLLNIMLYPFVPYNIWIILIPYFLSVWKILNIATQYSRILQEWQNDWELFHYLYLHYLSLLFKLLYMSDYRAWTVIYPKQKNDSPIV